MSSSRRVSPCAECGPMLAWALTFYRGDRYMANTETVHLTEENFDQTLGRDTGVMMVDFWAEWCGPCRAIAPLLEDLARESAGKVKLAQGKVDENPRLPARHGVPPIPANLFVEGGQIAGQVIGAGPP